MRHSYRIGVASLFAICAALITSARIASAQPVKNRISVMVDSSGSMLLTPQIVTLQENCSALWNPCTQTGNRTAAEESCNACVRDTINFRASCASNWTGPSTVANTCADLYRVCLQSVSGQTSCTANMTVTEGIPTRGDGSAELPGCDLNGDGQANESRMYQAKEALQDVTATFGEVEFSLWRYTQITGGQNCTVDGNCTSPLTCENHDNNAGTSNVCALDADLVDGPTAAGFEGQCGIFTWTGSPSTFACTACDFSTTYNRAVCEMYDLDRVRTGAVSNLNSSTVTCYPQADPTHRFMRYTGTCTGGEQLVNFPATGFADNYSQIFSWIDHSQPNFSTDVELRPQGGTPIAASLRNMRASVFANAQAADRVPVKTDLNSLFKTLVPKVEMAGALNYSEECLFAR